MSKRLDALRAELAKVFGRYSKWQLRCKEQAAATEQQQIRLAEEVLAEPCTGTVAEARTHALGLQGVKSVDLDVFLDRKTTKPQSGRRKQA
ncbi:MAG TPA: hypothetical protein VIK18_12655 [Pirellulales bacterium]